MKKLVPHIRATKGELKHTRKNYEMKHSDSQIKWKEKQRIKSTNFKLRNFQHTKKNQEISEASKESKIHKKLQHLNRSMKSMTVSHCEFLLSDAKGIKRRSKGCGIFREIGGKGRHVQACVRQKEGVGSFQMAPTRWPLLLPLPKLVFTLPIIAI